MAFVSRLVVISRQSNSYVQFCKRPSFTFRFAVFWTIKGGILQRQIPPFAKRVFCLWIADICRAGTKVTIFFRNAAVLVVKRTLKTIYP